MFYNEKIIREKCNEAIIITGAARSGTTILGKIIHSFKNVEYFFEPPSIISLLTSLQNIEEKVWKYLYEIYLFEDLFINALAGRSINCNIADDSSIFKVKPKDLIEKRLSISFNKSMSMKNIKKGQIAYKIPNAIIYLSDLSQYYPKHKIIVMTRNAAEVFNSIVAKGWFSNNTLINENVLWPNKIYRDMHVPYWVKEQDFEEWYKMNEVQRCAYYYIRINEPLLSIKNYLQIRYEDLIEDPLNTVKNLSKKLNLGFGEKTIEILDTVKLSLKKRNLDILNSLDIKLRDKVMFYSEQS